MKYLFPYLFVVFLFAGCGQSSPNGPKNEPDPKPTKERTYYTMDQFVMGADLSYVNQILAHGGTYSDSGAVENPYKIFSEYGANVVRLRLWHDPEWTASVYQGTNNPLYNNSDDVIKSAKEAKARGMGVSLDIHYSDTWADAGTQGAPDAWTNITELDDLQDSVYKYTKRALQQLNGEGVMPDFVQIGNEINCGLMYTDTKQTFPPLNVCNGNWQNAGNVINSGIKAVREVAANATVDTKVILHVAKPEDVEWWFSNMTSKGGVDDFDIIGFSYYAPYSNVSLNQISTKVASFCDTFDKEVMIVETAYPWTLDNADNYNNIFGQSALENGYPASRDGQLSYMEKLTQQLIDGGGSGIMYWEPAWITSDMKTRYGTGSAWENNAFFDFNGNVLPGIDYMTADYKF